MIQKVKNILTKKISFVGWKYVLNQFLMFGLGALYMFLELFV